MRFGLSLFGGAVTGLVIAAGASSCAASASAQTLVTRLGAVTLSAQAVAAPADVRRVAGVFPSVLTALATAAGASQVEFHPLPTTATGQAVAQTGQAVAEYNGYGFANGYSYSQARAVRRVRLFPKQAQAFAWAEGNAQTWQFGYANPARAKAIGFGTTYHVGNVRAVASANAYATPAMEIGGKGIGYAYSYAEGTCLYQGGVAGYGQASSYVLADPVVTKNGVVYQEANGFGVSSALGEILTTTVYQSQTARAYAILVAYPKTQVGGKGRASARALGYGDGLSMATGATLVAGNSAATVVAKASKQAKGKSTAVARVLATGDGLKRQTRVTGTGACRATAQATCLRTRTAKSTATARALITAQNIRTVTPVVPVLQGTATLTITTRQVDVGATPSGMSATILAEALRIAIGVGVANAGAEAQGFNQINDLAKAPASRTSTVGTESRTSTLAFESRTSTV